MKTTSSRRSWFVLPVLLVLFVVAKPSLAVDCEDTFTGDTVCSFGGNNFSQMVCVEDGQAFESEFNFTTAGLGDFKALKKGAKRPKDYMAICSLNPSFSLRAAVNVYLNVIARVLCVSVVGAGASSCYGAFTDAQTMYVGCTHGDTSCNDATGCANENAFRAACNACAGAHNLTPKTCDMGRQTEDCYLAVMVMAQLNNPTIDTSCTDQPTRASNVAWGCGCTSGSTNTCRPANGLSGHCYSSFARTAKN